LIVEPRIQCPRGRLLVFVQGHDLLASRMERETLRPDPALRNVSCQQGITIV
jgi:hypothetical protein